MFPHLHCIFTFFLILTVVKARITGTTKYDKFDDDDCFFFEAEWKDATTVLITLTDYSQESSRHVTFMSMQTAIYLKSVTYPVIESLGVDTSRSQNNVTLGLRITFINCKADWLSQCFSNSNTFNKVFVHLFPIYHLNNKVPNLDTICYWETFKP